MAGEMERVDTKEGSNWEGRFLHVWKGGRTGRVDRKEGCNREGEFLHA